MLDENKWIQYGAKGLVVKGITIHNTNSTKSAEEIEKWLNNENKGSNGCHFLIDSREVRQVMPVDWKVWHTGKGNDVAFRNTLAIEICESQCDLDTYMLAQSRAIEYIKALMKEYELTTKDLYFHSDFNNQFYCPHRILQIYKTKENFIRKEF